MKENMMRDMEDIPPQHPEALGVQEFGGFSLGETVQVEGFEGVYRIDKLDDKKNQARIRQEGAIEEGLMTVPLEKLKKVG